MKKYEVIYGGGEDPFTCPFDGARTDPVENDGKIYIEKCLECSKVLAFDFDEEVSYELYV
jgi:hypothetical protein